VHREKSGLLSRAAGILTADFGEIPLLQEKIGEGILYLMRFTLRNFGSRGETESKEGCTLR
jgi:hypothetical protein